MRFAVSGTHGSGKTTLIEDFAAAHPDYFAVPEPYVAMAEAGATFSDPPSQSDYEEQLEHSIETILATAGEANVAFDRCPLDFVAYLDALAQRAGEQVDVASVLDEIGEAIAALDLIVFLPLPPGDEMAAEYPRLQRAVDRRLKAIYRDDSLSLFASGKPSVIELSGTPDERLKALQRAVSR